MFKWEKGGLIFSPGGRSKWMYSHAQCPFPVDFVDFIRVYFCSREAYCDGMSRAYGGYVDLDRNDLTRVVAVAEHPILDLGGLGSFDEFGVMPGSVICIGGHWFLYYCGWTRSVSTPYNWAIGIADSADGKCFRRMGPGPILGPTLNEPYLQACPIVYPLKSGGLDMFYLSGIKWIAGASKPESQYMLMRATSHDGVTWVRDGLPLLESVVDDESQTSAAVFDLNGRHHMFFSYRCGVDFRENIGRGYRIGYAWSDDRITWHRDDHQAGIGLSHEGWDSHMIAYPHVLQINGRYVMFYCGNAFGEEGFGYAKLVAHDW
jgi:predicted GH43/DUF377 family glycosyl hydrolase